MTAGLLLVSLLAADPEQVFRTGPFEVVTRDEAKSARLVLNHLEQLRYAIGTTTGQPEVKPIWKVRVTITQRETSPGFKLARDAWEAAIAKNTPVPRTWNRALTQILINEGLNRMPERFERGLIDFFTTLEVSGVRVTAGTPPETVNRDWARVHLLMVNDAYRGRLRPLLVNLQQGADPAASFRNSLGVAEADVEKQLDEWMRAGNYGTTLINAKPINPDRDFFPREWEAPAATAMAAFAKGDYAEAARLKPDWPDPKAKLAEAESDPNKKAALLDEAAKSAKRDASLWRRAAEAQLARSQFAEAGRAWTMAERAAATEAEKAQMRKARLDNEEARAQFDEDEKRRKRQAAEDDLNRVRNAELARIRRAEAKANEALTPLDPNAKVVEFWEDKVEKASGVLERIECVSSRRFLVIRLPDKKTARFALPIDPTRMQLVGATSMSLDCGPIKAPAPKVTVHYAGKAPLTPEAVKLEIENPTPVVR